MLLPQRHKTLLGNTRILELGSMILVSFDVLITLDKEVRLVWNRPLNTASVLYFINRYFVLVQTALYLVSGFTPYPSQTCDRLSVYTNVWSVPLILTSVQGLVVSRLHALFRQQPIARVFSWGMLLVSFAITVALAGMLSPQVSGKSKYRLH